MVTQALYGFAPDLAPFSGQTPARQVEILRDWGCSAVFGDCQDLAFLNAARAHGLQVYAEFPCFVGRQWWEEAPASRPVTSQGALLAPEGWYYGVNPATDTVRRQRLEALEVFLADHALDGVWLDDGVIVFTLEGALAPEKLAVTLARFKHHEG